MEFCTGTRFTSTRQNHVRICRAMTNAVGTKGTIPPRLPAVVDPMVVQNADRHSGCKVSVSAQGQLRDPPPGAVPAERELRPRGQQPGAKSLESPRGHRHQNQILSVSNLQNTTNALLDTEAVALMKTQHASLPTHAPDSKQKQGVEIWACFFIGKLRLQLLSWSLWGRCSSLQGES